MSFVLNANTRIFGGAAANNDGAVENAVQILRRDLRLGLAPSDGPENLVVLEPDPEAGAESFRLFVTPEAIRVLAGDALGFVYGLLEISRRFLGVEPFWFWMDRRPGPRERILVPEGEIESPKYTVRFRGWFINDEVLLSHWSAGVDAQEPWRMAFEALLRCGGNMVIPGTDRHAHMYRSLAASYGLWITHHHAEALGAEFFLRRYPDLEPNFDDHPELFTGLWEEAVREQRETKVVWCLGYRGQGDAPFWASDTSGRYDTDEKRGAMISRLIRLQRAIVERYVPHPVFCTNLYGEVMELYARGHVDLDPDIIRIYADNGYGKMVSRRRGCEDRRVPALPEAPIPRGGIYYHVSFYDLQAANHMTMFPNDVDMAMGELDAVLDKNLSEYWLVNCSNIRPHAYMLDAVAKRWRGRKVTALSHSREFAKAYHGGSEAAAERYRAYPAAQLAFGPHPDQHAGEQFYCETPRAIVHQFFRDRSAPAPGLRWLTGAPTLCGQAADFAGMCRGQLPALKKLCRMCGGAEDGTENTVGLHARLQYLGALGGAALGEGFEKYASGRYFDAFVAFGRDADAFLAADKALRGSERGVWRGFYENDCFADYKHTAFMLQKLMGYMRELGDSPSHDAWYRLIFMEPRDRPIRVQLVEDNHPTDWELYLRYKANRDEVND